MIERSCAGCGEPLDPVICHDYDEREWHEDCCPVCGGEEAA